MSEILSNFEMQSMTYSLWQGLSLHAVRCINLTNKRLSRNVTIIDTFNKVVLRVQHHFNTFTLILFLQVGETRPRFFQYIYEILNTNYKFIFMKKLLLSLIAFCGFTAMNAEDVTLSFADAQNIVGTQISNGTQPLESFTIGEYTFSFLTTHEGAADTQKPTLWKDNTLRLYIGCQMTISGGNIAKASSVVLNAKKITGCADGAENLPSAPGFTTSYDETAKTISFVGATSDNFVMTLPDAKVDGKNPNYQISSITITYNKDGVVKEAAALKFAETEFNVMLGSEFTAPELTKATTAPAIYSSSNEEVATVDEETGNVTIIAAGQTTITATTAENEAYYAGEASYTINVVDGSKKAKSIAEIITFEDDAQFVVDFPMTVAFKSYYNTFATDGENFIQIYDKAQPDYNVGDVIPAGWVTKYKLYNSTTPELLPVSTLPEATETVEFTPAIVTEVTNADVNKVLKLQGVVLAEASPAGKANFTGTVNGVEFNFRNNYEKASVEAGTYDITFVVTIYQNAPSLYVIEYSQDTSGIESVEADDNAPVEYFNLQGVRVANPENGLFIRRQGNKVEKVVIR